MSIHPSPIRWPYVVVFAFLNLSNAWIWSTYAGASPTSALYYRMNESAITWFSLVFMAVYVPVAILSSWILDGYGLRTGLLIGTLLNATGGAVRYLSTLIDGTSGRFGLAFAGQVLAAVAQPFILNAAPKIANVYFGPSERTLADAVMNLANPIGAALALVIGPMLIDSKPDNVPSALLVSMIVALLPVPFAPFVFRKRVNGAGSVASVNLGETGARLGDVPLTPGAASSSTDPNAPSTPAESSLASPTPMLLPHASASAKGGEPPVGGEVLVGASPQIPFRQAARNLLRNTEYLKLVGAFGIAIGIFNTFVSEISFITGEVGYSEDEAGYLGFGAIICGIFGSLVAAILVDRSQKFKMFRESSTGAAQSPHAFVFKWAYTFALVALIGFAACTRRNLLALLVIWSCVFGFGAFAVLPTALELAVDMTYTDAGEAIGTGGMWAAGQLAGLVMAVVTDGIRNAVGAPDIAGKEVWIMPAVGVLGVTLAWSMNVDMKRVKVERLLADVPEGAEGSPTSINHAEK
ncbi:major facilitator superfamily domain-containing protein [Powellomyces hirtus]|nr:major facilitator superfamily domain-containing protein [Powellomyces hirtus]